MHRTLIATVLAVVSFPAMAAVISADAHGFEVQEEVNLVIPPAQAYAAFSRIGSWWNAEHSYSGNSANLRLTLQPGGCFCEANPKGGGVEHMRVGVVMPGERIVMTGSLGPLLYEAASGVMDIKFDRIAGGTHVSLNYRAAGFAKGNADKLAPLVDSVLADQMKRYRVFAAKGGGK